MIELSAILPTSQRPESSLRALQSLLGQSLENFEILVVINPKNPSLAENFQALDPRIRVLQLDGANASQARNLGAANARGHRLFFLDDDCEVSDRHFFDKLCIYLPQGQRKVAVGGSYNSPKNLGRTGRCYNFISELWLQKQIQRLPDSQYLLGGNWALYREDFLETKGFDENVAYGGSETTMQNQLRQKQTRLFFCQDLQVDHHAKLSLFELAKKAFLQSLRHRQLMPSTRKLNWSLFRQGLRRHRGSFLYFSFGLGLFALSGYLGKFWPSRARA